ncbi:MAG: 2-oxoacid:acceptor oxidoreductase family protein, partial [Alphaproteobacteria bacterium]|nr:2-oxoacid:acceptor oxidoreductase family protein [Alphaproteobacteria bacterium]
MYRIRFHGRGGQGMKTASRILGSAFFLSGFEVQDAPRYGAERRGAPIFAFVRAGRAAILERGNIDRPDLVVVADDTLVAIPGAGVLAGLHADSVLLLVTTVPADDWQQRLNTTGTVLTLPPPGGSERDPALLSALCAGAAARLTGAIEREALIRAVDEELALYPADTIAANRAGALAGFDALAVAAGRVGESGAVAADGYDAPDWIDLPADGVGLAAPTIHAGATSVEVRTGLWRTMRPVIDLEKCHRCTWVCGTFCPDGVIGVDAERYPVIDYDHCKGCMICLAQCPTHAIAAITER